MRLSTNQIKALQNLLQDEPGLKYTGKEVQIAGAAIMRFIVAKHRRANQLTTIKKGNYNENK